ncbi:MAG: hypothetical protein CMC13_01760 [Flavobacteriaceae bacterium]|nr:hypothetical protein [Flavobacteriaceae bacterium]
MSISLGTGGAERSAAMLSEMLHHHGHDVHIAILTNQIAYPYKGTLLNLGLLKSDTEKFGGRFKRILKLRAYLKKHSFDLIIDHRTKTNYNREVFYHKVIYKGIPKIYVVHSANRALYFSDAPKKLAKAYNKNNTTVGVSNYITEQLFPSLGVKNGQTVHNAFDDRWGADISEVPEILQHKKYILSYGRIDDTVKDFTFLLNAFTASNLWKEGCFLVILGDGPDKEQLKTFTQALPSQENIIFLQQQSPFSIVENAQCVTLTSRFEGFPMVLVEALSLGVPVVSLDIVSGPSEIVNDRENGLLIPKREVSLFAEGLQEMMQNEALRKNCETNAKASVAQFSMQEISKKWNKLVQDAIR